MSAFEAIEAEIKLLRETLETMQGLALGRLAVQQEPETDPEAAQS